MRERAVLAEGGTEEDGEGSASAFAEPCGEGAGERARRRRRRRSQGMTMRRAGKRPGTMPNGLLSKSATRHNRYFLRPELKYLSHGVRNLESKSAQGQKPAQEASQRRRKRLRHDLARGFHDYSRAEGPLRQTEASAAQWGRRFRLPSSYAIEKPRSICGLVCPGSAARVVVAVKPDVVPPNSDPAKSTGRRRRAGSAGHRAIPGAGRGRLRRAYPPPHDGW